MITYRVETWKRVGFQPRNSLTRLPFYLISVVPSWTREKGGRTGLIFFVENTVYLSFSPVPQTLPGVVRVDMSSDPSES